MLDRFIYAMGIILLITERLSEPPSVLWIVVGGVSLLYGSYYLGGKSIWK